MSPMIFKDVLGYDGYVAIKGIKKKHELRKKSLKRMIDMIKVSWVYQDEQARKKRRLLEEDCERSEKGTFTVMEYDWVHKFEEMKSRRGN